MATNLCCHVRPQSIAMFIPQDVVYLCECEQHQSGHVQYDQYSVSFMVKWLIRFDVDVVCEQSA